MRQETRNVASNAVERYPDASVEVIGAWVWLTFDGKPSTGTRECLKTSGFRWSPRRGQWSHNCGVPKKARMKSGHPRDVYGSIPVDRPYDREEEVS